MKNYSLRLGKSLSCYSDDFFTNLQKAKDLGFDTIDFDTTQYWLYKGTNKDRLNQLNKAIDAVLNLGMPVNGVHIPYGVDWDLSELNQTKNAENFNNVLSVINSTSRLSPYCYVLHGSFEPVDTIFREDKLNVLISTVKKLSALTDKIIALEILPRTCLLNTSKEIVKVVDKISMSNVKVCVDVNHFLQEKSEDGVLFIGNSIVTTHISDHDYENERHWMPGKGKIDWLKLIANLEKLGYNGVFNYELEVSLEEVKNNFITLFNNYNKLKYSI